MSKLYVVAYVVNNYGIDTIVAVTPSLQLAHDIVLEELLKCGESDEHIALLKEDFEEGRITNDLRYRIAYPTSGLTLQLTYLAIKDNKNES